MILVVEDDPNDALLLQKAFHKIGINMPVHTCTDGDDAMAYLQGRKHYCDRALYPFPRVLITDLKMPRRNGFELLEWLQQHPECNLIPKIVLSASGQPEDVVRAYQLGANCYFTKPSSFEQLCRFAELAHAFWFAAKLPPLPENC